MYSMSVDEINLKKKIDVVYCTDDNFVDVCCTSIVSMLENKGEEAIFLHIIDNSISDVGKEKIKQIVEGFCNTEVEFIPFPNLDELLSVEVKFDRAHLSVSTFGRLFVGDLLSKQIKRIIYLDCDTVVLKSLVELYEYNLEEHIIGGVDDCKSKRYRQVLGLKPKDNYINAGVLLIDLNKWRQEDCEKKVLNYINKYNGRIQFEDQGAINASLNQYILLLPAKFNVMTHNFDMNYKELMKFRNPVIRYKQEMIEAAMDNPFIIHFTSSFLTKGRVWNIDTNHKRKEIYNYYMKKASVEEKEGFSVKKIDIKEFVINKLPRNVTISIGYLAHEIIEPWKFFVIMRVAAYEKKGFFKLHY